MFKLISRIYTLHISYEILLGEGDRTSQMISQRLNIGSSNGLVPSGSQQGVICANVDQALRCHMMSLVAPFTNMV